MHSELAKKLALIRVRQLKSTGFPLIPPERSQELVSPAPHIANINLIPLAESDFGHMSHI